MQQNITQMNATKYKMRDNFNSFHPLTKLIFDILLTFLFFLISFGLGAFIMAKVYGMSITEFFQNSGLDGNISILRSSQMLYTLTLFLIPALLIAFFYSKNPLKYIGLTKSAIPANYLNAIIVMIFAFPVVNALAAINGSINLPAAFSGIENSMIEMEEKAKLVTEKILFVNSTKLLFLNLFMVALLPAIGEELIFRGILQKHFIQLTKNKHFGIFLTAFIFSAIHLQFLTFFPRLFLGIILGYFYVWSKSLWLPIVAHFTNNAFAVILVYYSHVNNLSLDKDIEQIGTNSKTFIFGIIGLLFLSLTMYFIKRSETKKLNS